MGLSNSSPGGQSGDSIDKSVPQVQAPQNFGQKMASGMENYLGSKFPVAGGLAHLIFSSAAPPPSSSTYTPTDTGSIPLPQIQMPQQNQPDFSLLSQNAQPKSSGFLKALLQVAGA